MGTRRAEQILKDIRRESKNEDYSSTSGMSQEELLFYINEGIADLQAAIVNDHERAFIAETYISTVSGQESYNLPSDMLDHGGLVSIEYSDSGSNQYFYKLQPLYLTDRSTRTTSNPSFYIRRNNTFMLRPVPATGVTDGLRVQYVKRTNNMDLRRSTVSAVTLAGGGISALTLNTSAFTTPNGFDQSDFLCIVDKYGNFKMQNIPFDSIDTATGVVTVSSGFLYASGETIAVGDYVCVGKQTSSHQIDFDASVERYLVAFAVLRAKQSDSNNDSAEAFQRLELMKQQIVSSYSAMDEDIRSISEINSDGN
jgi:hypothetical protein